MSFSKLTIFAHKNLTPESFTRTLIETFTNPLKELKEFALSLGGAHKTHDGGDDLEQGSHPSRGFDKLREYSAWALGVLNAVTNDSLVQMALAGGAGAYGMATDGFTQAFRSALSTLGGVMGLGQLLRSSRIMGYLNKFCDVAYDCGRFIVKNLCRLLLVGVLVAAAYSGVKVIGKICGLFFGNSHPRTYSAGDSIKFLVELLGVGILSFCGVKVCGRHVNTVLGFMNMVDFKGELTKVYEGLVSGIFGVIEKVVGYFTVEGTDSAIKEAIEKWNTERTKYTDETFEGMIDTVQRLCHSRVSRSAPYGTPTLSSDLKREMSNLNVGDPRLSETQKKRLVKLLGEATALVEENDWRCKVGLKRPPPVGVYFCGASNIGKSWGAQRFIEAFWKDFKKKAPREFFPKYLLDFNEDDALFYTRNASSEYFEGLVSQPIIYYGEAFQNCQDDDKLTQEAVSRERKEMQNLIDTTPYYPNYASLSTNREPGKGVAIAPVAVVAVSNYMQVPLGSDGYILGRRFDVALLVVWKRGSPEIKKDSSHLAFYRKKTTLFTNTPGDEGIPNWSGQWTPTHQLPRTEEEFDVWPWRNDWEQVLPRDIVLRASDAYFARLSDYRGVFESGTKSVFDGEAESVHKIPLGETVTAADGTLVYKGETFKALGTKMFERVKTGERWQLIGQELVFVYEHDKKEPERWGANCKVKDLVEVETEGNDNSCFFDAIRMAMGYKGKLGDFRKRIEARYTTDLNNYKKGLGVTRENMHVLAQRIGLKLCLHLEDSTCERTPMINGPVIHLRLNKGHVTWLKHAKDNDERLMAELQHRLENLKLNDRSLDSPQPPASERLCPVCDRTMDEPVQLHCAHRMCRKCVTDRGADYAKEERQRCPLCFLTFGLDDFDCCQQYREFCKRHGYEPLVSMQDLHATYRDEIACLEAVDKLAGDEALPRINQYQREELYLFEDCFNRRQRSTLETLCRMTLPQICRYQTLNVNEMVVDGQRKKYWKSSYMPPDLQGVGCGPFNLPEGAEGVIVYLLPGLEQYGDTSVWLGDGNAFCHVYGPLRAPIMVMVLRDTYVVYFTGREVADLLGVHPEPITADKPRKWRARETRGHLKIGHGVISGKFAYVSESKILDCFAEVHNMTLGQLLSLFGDEIPDTLAGTRLVALGDGPSNPFPEYERSTLREHVVDSTSVTSWVRSAMESRASWSEIAYAWVSSKLASIRDFFVNGWDSRLVALTTINALVAALGVAVVKVLVDYFGGGSSGSAPVPHSGDTNKGSNDGPSLDTNKDSTLVIDRVLTDTEAFTFSLTGPKKDVVTIAETHGWKMVSSWDPIVGGLPLFVSSTDGPKTINDILKSTRVRMKNVERFDAVKYATGVPMSIRACNFVPVRLMNCGDVVESVTGICLAGGIVIFPGHVLMSATAKDKLLVGNKLYGVREVRVNPLGDNKDVALVTKSNDFQRGIDFGYFVASDMVKMHPRDGDGCTALIWRDGSVLARSGVVHQQQMVDVRTVRGDQLKLIGYIVKGIEVAPGDCGAILVQNGKLMGFLSAAWPRTTGEPISLWTSLDRMSVKDLIDRFGDKDWPVSGVASATYDGPGKKSTRVAFGEAVANYPFHKTSPTRVVPNKRCPTELRDVIDPDHEWVPSDCSAEALEKAFTKFPTTPVESLPDEIAQAVEWYKDLWRPSHTLRRITSVKAAANGFIDESNREQILHRVDLSTSPSRPFSDTAASYLGENEKGEKIYGIGDKEALYPRRDENGNLVPTAMLERMTEDVLASWRQGVAPRNVVGLALKAEIRTKEAFEEHKCRLFVMPGHHINLAGRIEVGEWVSEMKRNGRKLHHAVGVNCHSGTDWTNLAKYIGKDGWRVICPDFSAYDTSHPSEMIMAVADVIASYYPRENKKAIRACLLTFNRFEARLPEETRGDASAASVTGLTSGSQVTTNLNCVVTSLLYLGAGLRYFGSRERCERNMRFVCYGDDAMVAIPSSVDGEDFCKSMVAFMAECGYKLTDANKGDVIHVGTMDDAVFLKRRFVRAPTGVYTAPLPENQVLRPLCFYPESNEQSDEVRQSAIRACVIEIAEQVDCWGNLHRENIYGRLKNKLKDAVATDSRWQEAYDKCGAAQDIESYAALRRQPGENFCFTPDGSVAVRESGAAIDEIAKCEWSY